MRKISFIVALLAVLTSCNNHPTAKAVYQASQAYSRQLQAEADSLIQVISLWNKTNPDNKFAIEKGGLWGYDFNLQAMQHSLAWWGRKVQDKEMEEKAQKDIQNFSRWIVKTESNFHSHIGDYNEWWSEQEKKIFDDEEAEIKEAEYIP